MRKTPVPLTDALRSRAGEAAALIFDERGRLQSLSGGSRSVFQPLVHAQKHAAFVSLCTCVHLEPQGRWHKNLFPSLFSSKPEVKVG